MNRWFRSVLGMQESFTDRMAHVADAHGLEVIGSDDDSCMVVIDCNGERLEMLMMLDSDNDVMMVIFSTISFPPGRLPEVICRTLEATNKDMTNCAYSQHNGRRASKFTIRSWLPLSGFTPTSFARAVEMMAPRMTGLDEFLEQKGFVRR